MKFDVLEVLKDHRGREVAEGGSPLTYEKLVEAVCNLSQESGEKRLQVFRLMLAVAGRAEGEPLELTNSDVAMLREMTLKAPFGAVVTGRLLEWLDSGI